MGDEVDLRDRVDLLRRGVGEPLAQELSQAAARLPRGDIERLRRRIRRDHAVHIAHRKIAQRHVVERTEDEPRDRRRERTVEAEVYEDVVLGVRVGVHLDEDAPELYFDQMAAAASADGTLVSEDLAALDFTSFKDYVRYQQSTQGHLNADGLCAIARNFPSPR